MQVAAALNTSTSGTEMELDDSSMQLIIQQDESSNYTVETLPELKIDPDSTMSSAMSGGSSSSSSSLSSLSGSGDEDTDSSFLLKDVATVEKTVSLNTTTGISSAAASPSSAAIAEGNNVTLVSDQVTKAVNAMELPEGASIEFNGRE